MAAEWATTRIGQVFGVDEDVDLAAFQLLVGELRVKAQIRDTFGKYVDPRIVAGLIDRPDLTDAKGSRREMTILFCDMTGFTAFSEGMTPAALVNVLNRYMTVMSEPVRHNNGIINKYIGDGSWRFGARLSPTAKNILGLLACWQSTSWPLPHSALNCPTRPIFAAETEGGHTAADEGGLADITPPRRCKAGGDISQRSRYRSRLWGRLT